MMHLREGECWFHLYSFCRTNTLSAMVLKLPLIDPPVTHNTPNIILRTNLTDINGLDRRSTLKRRAFLSLLIHHLSHSFVGISYHWGSDWNSSCGEENFLDDCSGDNENQRCQKNDDNQSVCSTQSV